MTYIISYDIHEPKRLKSVSKYLEDFARRIQASVFQCELENGDMEKVKKILLSMIDQKEDSLLIFPICKKCIETRIALGIELFSRKDELFMIL